MKFQITYTKVVVMDVDDKFAPMVNEPHDDHLVTEFWLYANKELGLEGSIDECVCCVETEDGNLLAEW